MNHNLTSVNFCLNTYLNINSELRIYDITGKKLMAQILTDEATIVNISHLQSGIYFCEIDKKITKIIKN